MRFLSLFSGIEAASVAWTPLGWQCVGVAEIDPFPAAVLAHHYQDVPNLGDVTTITDEQIAALGPIDLVVGGSPCQDLSVAGKRAGLAGERSGLFHEQLRIFHAARHLCGARYLLWENVPGAFSSNRGRDFAVVVGEMAGCSLPVPADGWGTEGVVLGEHGLVEWAVLDAQWFGVAQRRRRVFALLDVGDWASRPPILLERDSLRGDSAPSREAGERVARPIAAGSARGSGYRNDADTADNLIPAPHADLSPALKARDSKGPSSDGDGNGGQSNDDLDAHKVIAFGGNNQSGPIDVATARNACASASGGMDFDTETFVVGPTHTLRGEGFDASADRTRAAPVVTTLAIRGRGDSHDLETRTDGTANALLTPNGGRAGIGVGAIRCGMQVRRLTVKECSRLQGFPDNYLLQVPWRGKPHPPDGPMYKALGNSMAVPVMRWIGEQIQRIAA